MTEIPNSQSNLERGTQIPWAGDIMYGTLYPNNVIPPEYEYDDNGDPVMEMAYCSLGQPLGLTPKCKTPELPTMDQIPEDLINAVKNLMPGYNWHDWNFQRQQNINEE